MVSAFGVCHCKYQSSICISASPPPKWPKSVWTSIELLCIWRQTNYKCANKSLLVITVFLVPSPKKRTFVDIYRPILALLYLCFDADEMWSVQISHRATFNGFLLLHLWGVKRQYSVSKTLLLWLLLVCCILRLVYRCHDVRQTELPCMASKIWNSSEQSVVSADWTEVLPQYFCFVVVVVCYLGVSTNCPATTIWGLLGQIICSHTKMCIVLCVCVCVSVRACIGTGPQ